MSMKEKFLIVKDEETKEIRYFDYEKIKGYNLQAKKNIHFQDSIDVSRMIIIKPTFIEKIATKKINAKFDRLINLVSMVCDQEDDEKDRNIRRWVKIKTRCIK